MAANQGTDAGVGCPALNGLETVHQNDVTTAETWAGDGTVHHITFGFTVRPGGSLTLASCAVVKVNWAILLTVDGTAALPARLVAQGRHQRRVVRAGRGRFPLGRHRLLQLARHQLDVGDDGELRPGSDRGVLFHRDQRVQANEEWVDGRLRNQPSLPLP